ncbi:MAG: hypothetical protein QXY45_04430 [Candidatus Aenigmatarchaeota archaeon]
MGYGDDEINFWFSLGAVLFIIFCFGGGAALGIKQRMEEEERLRKAAAICQEYAGYNQILADVMVDENKLTVTCVYWKEPTLEQTFWGSRYRGPTQIRVYPFPNQ